MKFNDYKFRSHMVGNIVTVPRPLTANQAETLSAYRERLAGNGRPLTEKQTADWHSLEHKLNESKIYKLTDGQKNILTNLAWAEKTGRKISLSNKYFEKGTVKEKESRDLISDVLGIRLVKDDERRSNDCVTGKRDIKHDKVIFDIKTAFSFESFNKHLTDSPNEIYLRQLDCYMELWGVDTSILCHVLVDTPFNIVDDEIRRMDWKLNILDMAGTVRDEHIQNVKDTVCEHIYTRQALEDFCMQSTYAQIEWFEDFIEIPVSERIHMIPHSFSKERIEQRNECIKLAREYMNTVKPINKIEYVS